MHDPYMPVEAKFNMTGRALELIAEFGFGVHVNTKSDLILRDLDTLCQINRVHASVCFSITTADDVLGKSVEPGAALVSARFRAMKVLAEHGIPAGVAMMPILPFIQDTEENIKSIVRLTYIHGGAFILPWFGMSLRDRQRAYYYDQLDRLFPGVRREYERTYGDRYQCAVPNAGKLREVFEEACAQYGIATDVKRYQLQSAKQLTLL
jgi:DNA repair photolyase